MIGQNVAQYHIKSELGRGGMGVVYLASDTRLKRDVALKFLADHLVSDSQSVERFEREAQAAAALNHTNICGIHDIQESEDGRTFIVMPYYSGETLQGRLESGSVSADEAVKITSQILSGLQAAHSQGIVHRDIKPGNILLADDGRVMILDFGLAKLQGAIDITRSGSTLGTMSYMSPEQVQSGETDARTDLWAVGVLLYEMLTGSRPFEGEFEAAILYSIANSEVNLDHDSIPGNLRPVLRRMLQKNPADRYQASEQVIQDLTGSVVQTSTAEPAVGKGSRWLPVAGIGVLVIALLVWRFLVYQPSELAPPAAQGDVTSVSKLAVLPFVNVKADEASNFLGFALADQVIGSLGYVNDLVVRPASSVRKYQDAVYDLDDVRTDLDVDVILTGSFIHEDDFVRLTVEMVDAESKTTIWREPIESRYESTFKLQDEVADAVVRRLELESLTEGSTSDDTPSSPEAYEFYLRAVAAPFTVAGAEIAIEMLRQSLALDSTYAPTYDQLGFRYLSLGQYDLGGVEPIDRAREAYEKALELNPNLLSALANLATLHVEEGNTVEAVHYADRIAQINPNNVVSHFARGYAFRYSGFIERSVEAMRKGLEIDKSYARLRSAGITFYYADLFDEALEAMRIDAESDWSTAWRAIVMLKLGDEDAARDLFNETIAIDPDGLLGWHAATYLAEMDGDTTAAIRHNGRILETGPVDSEIWYHTARRYCFVEAFDPCISTLDRALEAGYYSPYHLNYDTDLATFRSKRPDDFERLLRKAGDLHAEAAKALGLEPRVPGPYRPS